MISNWKWRIFFMLKTLFFNTLQNQKSDSANCKLFLKPVSKASIT